MKRYWAPPRRNVWVVNQPASSDAPLTITDAHTWRDVLHQWEHPSIGLPWALGKWPAYWTKDDTTHAARKRLWVAWEGVGKVEVVIIAKFGGKGMVVGAMWPKFGQC